ncbi:MAG: CPBP family intramembrane metalloprotease [Bacteroidales bacterium]|nr:CPBP family intramembrane metalloprotease [Bacteroidales bacterium]
MKEPLFEKAHPFIKIIFLFFIIIVSISVSVIFTEAVSVNKTELFKLLTALQHILIFIIPPIFAAYIYSKSVKKYLYLNNSKSSLIFLTILIVFFAIPVINFTGLINSNLSLPEGLSGLEDMMKKMEESAKIITEKFLNVDTVGGLIINIIIIAVLPAIGEELLFRGVLLRLLNDLVKNMHIAIIISAFVFSFIHLQFYGFIPRMLLGILFGYLLYWSGSIWLPILAHFINNTLAVTAFYFMKDTDMYEKTENFGAEPSSYLYMIFSAALLFLFFYLFWKEGKGSKIITHE